jgi:hypothetical protein
MSNGALGDRVVCLSLLSKDLEGELRLVDAAKESCEKLGCVTLDRPPARPEGRSP